MSLIDVRVIISKQPQANYILGKNPKSMSYLVGYGANYPVHVHDRGASIISTSILHSVVECVEGFEKWYSQKDRNPMLYLEHLLEVLTVKINSPMSGTITNSE
ncbi:hypothetical protein IFM89_014866 [Coptis chinensis]|uniref:Endoglucanase n=1 Tax=Coptis chinensis TaxID=261450 RepID=A0A835M804_9MAGN|nr:hypothetical protein IFM89_014866 [Coptis chinensis]